MVTKKIIITGFTATALLTALTLSELLPGLVLALISIIVGISLTFYVALAHRRIIHIEEQRILLEFTSQLITGIEPAQIKKCYYKFVKKLISCEQVILYDINNRSEIWEEYDNYWLSELSQWISSHNQMLLYDGNHPWPDGLTRPDHIRSIIGVNLKGLSSFEGTIFLINEKTKGYFSEREQEIIAFMVQQAAAAWNNFAVARGRENHLQELTKIVVQAIETQEDGFSGHSERVAEIACLTGEKLGLNQQELQDLYHAALLHDIGKVAGNSVMDAERTTEVLDHATLGAALLPDSAPWAVIKEAILFHHERYDGQGYPKGLKTTEIPLLARIIAAADLYDALTYLIPDQERMSPLEALQILKKASGTILDPLVVVAMEETDYFNG